MRASFKIGGMASEFDAAPSIAPRRLGRGRLGLRVAAAADWIEAKLEAERDQLPLWLPVGLGGGIAAWFLLPGADPWRGFIAAMASIALISAGLGSHRRSGRGLAWLALAAAIGCALIWWRAESAAAPRLTRPLVTEVRGRVVAVEPQPARDVVRVRIATTGGLPPLIRVNLPVATPPPGLVPGAGIAVRARLMPPAPPAVPGAYDFERVAWFQGIGATGRALGDPVLAPPTDAPGWWARLGEVRRRLSAHIQSRLAGSEGGIASSLATGDQGAIADEDAEAMRRSGLAHLLSISGLHVTAVVAAAMLLAMRLLALSPRLALTGTVPLAGAGAGALAGIGYTLLAGAEVPTVRSCIAALLVLAGMALGREAVTLRLVATGAVIVMLLWPEAIAGPSFQLSFAAVTAIVALHESPRLRGFLAPREESGVTRWLRSLFGLFLTGVLIELALSPIALFHFHQAGLYGAAANVIAIPLTTFLIMPAEALALLLDTIGLGAPAWWVAGRALAALLGLAHAAANAPGAVAALPSMPTAAFAMMLAGGLWLALWRSGWRLWGLAPFAIGAGWALATPPPDLLVTGDGRHLALRGADGRLALLRPRAGDYVRDLLGEASGIQAEALDLAALPGAACTRDLCAATIVRGGRRWRVAATRSPYLIDIAAMNRACAGADIVVSDRRLPRSCRPRWFKADRELLARSGGLAVRFAPPSATSVAGSRGAHPWNSFASPAAPAGKGMSKFR